MPSAAQQRELEAQCALLTVVHESDAQSTVSLGALIVESDVLVVLLQQQLLLAQVQFWRSVQREHRLIALSDVDERDIRLSGRGAWCCACLLLGFLLGLTLGQIVCLLLAAG